MSKTTKNLTALKLHKLSQEQYNTAKSEGLLDVDALYLTPDVHTHGELTNEGELSKESSVVVTTENKKLTTSANISTTELDYLNNITSGVQSQINTKVSTDHATSSTVENPYPYGTATATEYGHMIATSAVPRIAGIAEVGGLSSGFARGDHVHPLQTSVSGSSGSCTGNAATATRATQDGNGNNIVNTYATKNDLTVFSLDHIYPIGRVYLSMEPASPASFLGGT
jgi:hypothetical protein